MRPGSVATAGAASGRPSHHHAAATATAARMNKATSLRIKIPCYADGVPGERRRTHSIEAPGRNPPRPGFARAEVGAAHASAAQSQCPSKDFSCRITRHDWTKSATSAIDDEENLET